MKRKDYQKPTMLVVKLKHRTHLLNTSVEATMNERFVEKDIDDIDN